MPIPSPPLQVGKGGCAKVWLFFFSTKVLDDYFIGLYDFHLNGIPMSQLVVAMQCHWGQIFYKKFLDI